MANPALTAALAGLVLVGFLLRISSFTDALFGDELSSYLVVHDHSLSRMFDYIHSDQEATPPLYFLTATVGQHLGDASYWLRLGPLLAGLAAIPLTFELGRRTVGRDAGLVAAAVMTLSPFLIYYSTEARSYGLSMFMCLISTLALLRASEGEASNWWRWGLYAVLAAAPLYTHYTNVFVVIAQTGWVFLARPQARKPLIIASIAAAVLFLPWLHGYIEDRDSPTADVLGAINPLSWHTFRVDLSRWAVGLPYFGVREFPGGAGIAAIAAGLGVGLFGGALALRRSGVRPSFSSPLVLIVVLAAAAPVGTALYSLLSVDVWSSRNMISSWPGFAVLIAAIVTSPVGRTRVAAITLVLAGYAVGAVKVQEPENQRPDYNQAADYLLDHATPADPIVDGPLAAPAAQQALGVALDDRGASDLTQFRVGLPSLERDLAQRSPEGPGQYALLPPVPGRKVAQRAVAAAADGRIFFVAAGDADFESLKAFVHGTVEGDFLDALPPSYHETAMANFPGLLGGVTVHTLEEGSGSR